MMKDSTIQVICGPGKGKTASALGRGISALIHGKNVIMVQFLKGSMDSDNMEVLKRLEPILDEILGILDEGILTLEELCALIGQARQSEAELIMTGTVYPAALDEWVDEVTKLQTRFE